MRPWPSSESASPRMDGRRRSDGSVEPRAANRARAHELVVAAEDELAAAKRGRRRRARRARPPRRERRRGRAPRRRARARSGDLVARALVGEESRRDLADDARRPRTRAGSPVSVTSPITACCELPAVEHRLDGLEHLRADDRDHPLLALGDHHLPGLHSLLAQRHAVEVDVDPESAAISESDDAMPAAPQSWSDSTSPDDDELDGRLDQLLPRERVADLDRRPLLRRALVELLAREHGRAADPVAARRRPVEDDARGRRRSPSRACSRSTGSSPTHIALTRQLSRYASSNTASPPTVGTPTQFP